MVQSRQHTRQQLLLLWTQKPELKSSGLKLSTVCYSFNSICFNLHLTGCFWGIEKTNGIIVIGVLWPVRCSHNRGHREALALCLGGQMWWHIWISQVLSMWRRISQGQEFYISLRTFKLQKPGMLVHTWHLAPGKKKQSNLKVEVSCTYTVSSRPNWEIWLHSESLSQKKGILYMM